MKKYISIISGMMLAGLTASADVPADRGLSNAPGVDITIDSLFAILAGLACWATRFIMVIMVIMIVWYGLKMMTAQGSDIKFKDARKSLGYAVVGMIVILGAYTIIATVGNTIQGIGAQNLSTRSSNFVNYTPLGSCSY